MKVLVLGGYGVFGPRLAELNHDVDELDLSDDASFTESIAGLDKRPHLWLPRSDSREFVQNGAFHFDVTLGAPLGGGLMVRYRGELRPDGWRFEKDDARSIVRAADEVRSTGGAGSR